MDLVIDAAGKMLKKSRFGNQIQVFKVWHDFCYYYVE